MSDVFSRQQAAINKTKALRNLSLFEAVSCDNMATFQIEDCLTCKNPCKEYHPPKPARKPE